MLCCAQASAGFPESAPSDTRETLDPTAPAGKQLEQSRTGIPAQPEQSNATAASAAPKAAAPTAESTPPQPEQPNSAAASAAPKSAEATAGSSSSQPEQSHTAASARGKQAVTDEPAGKELQQTVNSVPPSLDESNAAAEQKLGVAAPLEAKLKGKQRTKAPAGNDTLQVCRD